jgi:phosphoribosyl 1,2-cyclic phosphodiesterase
VRFASLGSGSRGNALLVEAGATLVLVDCGFSIRQCEARLARLAVDPGTLSGIVVTHEHADHSAGVFKLAEKYCLPIWLTGGTLSAVEHLCRPVNTIRSIDDCRQFSIGDLEFFPFPVSHDAREPVQFVVANGVRRLGVLTDVGCSTPHIVAMLSGCNGLFLECNHDAGMLARNGSYPAVLKRRISGRLGHLENAAAAKLLAQLDLSCLQHVVAAHLSAQNNTPWLAATALAEVLGCDAGELGVATQNEGSDWRELR